jgi:hypothetical protein
MACNDIHMSSYLCIESGRLKLSLSPTYRYVLSWYGFRIRCGFFLFQRLLMEQFHLFSQTKPTETQPAEDIRYTTCDVSYNTHSKNISSQHKNAHDACLSNPLWQLLRTDRDVGHTGSVIKMEAGSVWSILNPTKTTGSLHIINDRVLKGDAMFCNEGKYYTQR